jgi:hypothetical protein
LSSLVNAGVLSFSRTASDLVLLLSDQYVDHDYMSRSSALSLQRVLCSIHKGGGSDKKEGNDGPQCSSWLTQLAATLLRPTISTTMLLPNWCSPPTTTTTTPTPKHYRALYDIANKATSSYVRTKRWTSNSNKELLARDVTTTLRPYQLDAVDWAMGREGVGTSVGVGTESLQRATEDYLEYAFEDDDGRVRNFTLFCPILLIILTDV